MGEARTAPSAPAQQPAAGAQVQGAAVPDGAVDTAGRSGQQLRSPAGEQVHAAGPGAALRAGVGGEHLPVAEREGGRRAQAGGHLGHGLAVAGDRGRGLEGEAGGGQRQRQPEPEAEQAQQAEQYEQDERQHRAAAPDARLVHMIEGMAMPAFMPPDTVEDLVARALAEDLGDGDVTTAATVAAGRPGAARSSPRRPRGHLRARRRRAGVPRARSRRRVPAARSPRASGATAARWPRSRAAPGRCCPASGPRSTSCSGCRAWPRCRPLRPGGRRAPARGSSTPARRRPGCAPLEKAAVAAGGAHQPPRRALRRDPDQGEPRGDGRRRRRGRAPGPGSTRRSCRSRSSAAPSAEVDEALAAGAPAASCWTT